MQPIATHEFPPHVIKLDIVPIPGAQELLVREFYYTIDIWSLIIHYWPEALQILAVITAFISVIKLIINRRRRRTPHSAYCRRCNYCLDDITPAACPECGAPLPKKRTVAPTYMRQYGVPAILILISIPCFTIPEMMHVPRSGAINHWITWRSQPLEQRARDDQWSSILRHTHGVSAFSRLDIKSQTIGKPFITTRGEPEEIIAVSPDAKFLIVADWTGRFDSYALPSGRRCAELRKVPELATGKLTQSLVGFRHDRREVLFATLQRKPLRTTVSSVDYLTGSRRIEYESPPDFLGGGSHEEPYAVTRQVTLIHAGDGLPMFFDAHHFRWDRSTPFLLVRNVDNPEESHSFEAKLDFWMSGAVQPVENSDTALIRLFDTNQFELVNWRTGEVIWSHRSGDRLFPRTHPSAFGVSPTGRYAWESFLPMENLLHQHRPPPKARTLNIIDVTSGAVLRSVTISQDVHAQPVAAFTEDDQFLCVTTAEERRRAKVLGIYDMMDIKAASSPAK